MIFHWLWTRWLLFSFLTSCCRCQINFTWTCVCVCFLSVFTWVQQYRIDGVLKPALHCCTLHRAHVLRSIRLFIDSKFLSGGFRLNTNQISCGLCLWHLIYFINTFIWSMHLLKFLFTRDQSNLHPLLFAVSEATSSLAERSAKMISFI